MRNIWTLFRSDLHRLFSNVVTGIIVLGLVALPSIFSWYNILACWDVFDNTGNLKVAVANTDEGYESDLVAIRVNIGDSVVSALRANDQLDWVITDEADAVDGAMSGKYYAAVVIPQSFSADMLTFYSDDVQRADIVYYTNEKRSAIAPKVTDQGADRVAYQVNKTFAETLARISLSIFGSLSDYLDDADAQSKVASLANHLQRAGDQMAQASSAIRSYIQAADSSKKLVNSIASLLGEVKASADEAAGAVSQGKDSLEQASAALDAAARALDSALADTKAYYDKLPNLIDSTYSSIGTSATDTAAALRAQVPVINENIAALRNVSNQLESAKSLAPSEYKPSIEAVKALVDNAITLQGNLKQELEETASGIESENVAAQADHEEAAALAAKAKASIEDLSTSYNSEIKPQIDELKAELGSLATTLKSAGEQVQRSAGGIKDASASVDTEIDSAIAKLDGVADKLDAASSELKGIGGDLSNALASNDIDAVRDIISANPEALAAALSAPVVLDRTEVFPASNFGSQMSPLYTMLALWIGSLLLSVAVRVIVPREDLDKLDEPKHHQVFLGHFGAFALISLMQSTCMALGNMLFLGVQVNHPALYLLCFWVSGLVFAFIIYSLVTAFANLGKAIAVLMLIVQVTGCNGAFPLQLLPSFIQRLSAWLPGTHTINAMRAAMFGVYNNDYWISMGLLLLFLVPAGIIGLALSKQLSKFMAWYIKRVESSKLMA